MRTTIVFPIILLNILLFPFLMNAQRNYQDVVYLKNGSVIHGMIMGQVPNIMEQAPDDSIKIQTADKKIFVFKLDEIEKITKEIIPHKQSGFMNRTELEIGGPRDYLFGLRTINGYQINKHWSMAIGLGLINQSMYSYLAPTTSFDPWTMPVFIDLKYDISRNNHSFYFYVDGGYSILLSSANVSQSYQSDAIYYIASYGIYAFGVDTYTISLSNEFMAGCGVGYSVFISPETEWTISIAINTSGLHEIDTQNSYDYRDILNSSNSLSNVIPYYFALRTGFIF